MGKFVNFTQFKPLPNARTDIQAMLSLNIGFPGGLVVKDLPANVGDVGSTAGLGRSPGEGNSNPYLPGEFHGWWKLTGYSPWGCKRIRHNLATKQQQ